MDSNYLGFHLATKLENWRIQYISGTRNKWVYLPTDEEAAKWPLSDVEKFNLRIPIEDHLKVIKQPTTPYEASMNGLLLLKRSQAPNGDFVGCCTDIMYLTPMYVFAFHILGFGFPEYQRIEQIRYILYCSNPDDGGWGIVFGTALNYASLRILGLEADHPHMIKARRTLRSLGGALGASMWGKFWLCLLNVYDWSGINSIPPEIWLLPDWLQIHPRRWYMFIREFHASMSYLYRVRFKSSVTELTLALRRELYVEDYDKIDWPSQRNSISKRDEHVPTSFLMRAIYSVFNMTLESCRIPFLNKYALDKVYRHVCYEVENSDYTCVVSCCSALNLLVRAHAEGVNSPSVREQRERADEFLWMTPEGLRVAVCTSIPAWAGGFIGHMLFETGFLWETPRSSTVKSTSTAKHEVI